MERGGAVPGQRIPAEPRPSGNRVQQVPLSRQVSRCGEPTGHSIRKGRDDRKRRDRLCAACVRGRPECEALVKREIGIRTGGGGASGEEVGGEEKRVGQGEACARMCVRACIRGRRQYVRSVSQAYGIPLIFERQYRYGSSSLGRGEGVAYLRRGRKRPARPPVLRAGPRMRILERSLRETYSQSCLMGVTG